VNYLWRLLRSSVQFSLATDVSFRQNPASRVLRNLSRDVSVDVATRGRVAVISNLKSQTKLNRHKRGNFHSISTPVEIALKG
jgi:hypothetical protein